MTDFGYDKIWKFLENSKKLILGLEIIFDYDQFIVAKSKLVKTFQNYHFCIVLSAVLIGPFKEITIWLPCESIFYRSLFENVYSLI